MSNQEEICEYADGMFWYTIERDVITIGVTQKALDLVGPIQEIEFPELNDEFLIEDWIGELHGKNTEVALTAPRALKIQELNEEVQEQSSMLEDDPTGDAWLVRATLLS